MNTVMEWIGPLSVTERAVLGVAAMLFAFLVIVAVTSLLTGLRAAFIVWGVVLLAGLLWIFLMPVETDDLAASPMPEPDFQAAMARFEADLATSPEPLNPLCEPYVLSHGQKTRSVVVLLHGVSSCPRAFVDFAPLLHERGHTVLVVRMPYNGFADRGTDALKNITAEGLAAFGDDVVDVAEGLGEEVIFLGISAGGTIAGWAAQNRAEVDRGVLVAPFYGLGRLGPRVNLALMRAMLVLPNVSLWKDPALRERWDGMAHAYARQSSRATAEIIRLGLGTYRQADERAAEAREIVVITNEADTAVSNATTDAVVAAWREQGVPLTTYAFPARHGLGHELIDPEEPGADPALTYPVILQLLEDPDAFDPDALPAVGGGPSAAPASAGASSP